MPSGAMAPTPDAPGPDAPVPNGAAPDAPGPTDGAPLDEGGEPALLVAIDRLLFPRSGATYTVEDLAAQAGVSVEVADRLWRAMGFTAGPKDRPFFHGDDLEALRSAVEALRQGVPLDKIVYQTRVMAAALARVGEVTSDVIVESIEGMRAAGLTEAQIIEALTSHPQPDFDRLVGYFYRRQLEAALWRKVANPERLGSPELTVGFVDLVRFTAVTEGIADEELGALVDRFESVVHDAVTDHGGRIVKMIGDEAMFVTDAPADGLEIALSLVDSFARDESVPPARAGVAHGPVLAHGGDYFGPTVNLSARIVDVARSSTVVASESLHDALAARADLTWRRLPPKKLKGIGRVPLW